LRLDCFWLVRGKSLGFPWVFKFYVYIKHKYASRIKNNRRYYVNTCLKSKKIRQHFSEWLYYISKIRLDKAFINGHIRCECLCSKYRLYGGCRNSLVIFQGNDIRPAISEWGKNNIEPLREHPMVLLTIKSIQHERFNNQLSGRT